MKKIDVSKCKYFDEEYCSINKHAYVYCCQKKGCYYKQLQQLKAELQAYENNVRPCNCVESEEYLKVVLKNKQIKADNEELKARNIRGALAFLEEDFKKEQKIKKYKQCLDEIEEICKNSYTTEQQYYHRTSDMILEKIKEVRGEE